MSAHMDVIRGAAGSHPEAPEDGELCNLGGKPPAIRSQTASGTPEPSGAPSVRSRAADQIRYFINLKEVSPALKEKLKSALAMKGEWDGAKRELAQVVADLQRLNTDQDRIRKNLRETPSEAEVYKTYLKKLDAQEKEIDSLTARQKKLMGEEFEARKKYDAFLVNLTD